MKCFAILATLVFLFFAGCKKESIENPDFPDACDYELGEFMLLTSSIDSFPYEGKSKIFFSDSLGHEIALLVSTEETEHIPTTFETYQVGTSDILRFCFYQQNKIYYLVNDSLSLHIKAILRVQPSFSVPLNGKATDELRIEVTQRKTLPLYVIKNIFIKTLADHSGAVVYPYQVLDSLACFNETHYNVEYNDFFPISEGVYYKHPYGIIAFKDLDDKRWCFERFE